ncbi:MAG: protein phosphatase CheZ [Oceanococcus sp.]
MDRTQLAERLGALHDAARDGDWSGVENGLRDLDEAKTAAFAEGIRKMARDLYSEMRALQLDSRLATAAAEIPDACSRLDAVMELTEKATTRTLDLVEDSRDHVIQLQALAQQLPPESAKLLEQHTASLRKNMSSLYEAQSYQDLSGQIIRRVTTMVGNLDGTLREMLALAGVKPVTLIKPEDGELLGPAAGRTDEKAAASQDDADALLADLGI